MSPAVLSLLCPGFFLFQSVWALMGDPDKPTLSAQPSSIIPQGEHVVLKCDSSQEFDTFQLYKEDGSHVPEIEDRKFQKYVLLGPVTPAHAGSYRCSSFLHSPHRFSAPSDPLGLTITGIYRKPFLLAQPGPLVKSGEKVTLQCVSQVRFEIFILVLHRDGVAQDPWNLTGDPQDETSQANFSIDPVTATYAGTYRCYGSLSDSPYEWSAPSDPLDLVVTGLHKKPFLSVQLDPGARPDGNVTLSCSSEHPFDMFHLSRERQGWPLRHQAAAQRGELMFQADFLLGPGAHSATYRCYGSFSGSRHVWTAPSDPVHLSVTGSAPSSSLMPPPTDRSLNPDARRRPWILTALWAPLVLLTLILVLVILAQRWRSARKRRGSSDAGGQGCMGSPDAGASTQKRGPKADEADPRAEEALELTYTELDHWVSTQKRDATTTQRYSTPQAHGCVYAELAKR
uniref:Ig-like domain-containing protein n=1 Tax=Cavia porcellus TaxID=10141 RepID=H0VA20_CAVPO